MPHPLARMATVLVLALTCGACSGDSPTNDPPGAGTPGSGTPGLGTPGLGTPEAGALESGSPLLARALPIEPVAAPSSVERDAVEILAAESLELVVNYGVMLLSEKNFDGATYAFDHVLRLNGESIFAWYNLACVRSLQGDAQGALAALRKSIEFGYDQFEHMQQDPDLEAIRSLPEYQALLTGHGAAPEVTQVAPTQEDAVSSAIVPELVGGFRKTTVSSSGGMSFVTDRYLWLHANGQCEDGSKAAGGDGGSSFRNGDGSPSSTGTWSGTADTLSLRWNDGSVEDYTWFWYDNGVSGVQLLLSSGGSNYRYRQFE